MTCHCWHIVGEHYRCSLHGGVWGFTAGAPKTPVMDAPADTYNVCDPWFEWIDRTGPKVPREATP